MSRRTNRLRRGGGAIVAFGPVALLVASLAYALARGSEHHPAGVAVVVGALAIGALNFHLSFVRGLLYRRAKGSMQGYRFVSGYPLIGTFLVVVGALLGFGSAACAVLGLLAMGIDTGGSVWFLIATWKDAAFWDGANG